MSAKHRIRPVIMSGGAGTRLWPLSRAARPKQFLPLVSNLSILQETLDRIRPAEGSPFQAPLIIANARHTDLIRSQAEEMSVAPAAIICEPAPRNTAPAAAVAAAWCADAAPQSLVLLKPADHHIADAEGFRRAVEDAAPAAAAGRIVTFGIRPTGPNTGYGYIERGEAFGGAVSKVAAFREKPDAPSAEEYVAGGRHFWNAGIFLFRPDVMLAELAAFAPAICDKARAAYASAARRGDVVTLDAKQFEACPSQSIDYAVMEKTDKAAVIAPVDVGWSDIGAWSELGGRKGDETRVCRIDADGALVISEGPFVGVIGADDIVVVASEDAVLVAPKSRTQDVKKIVEALKARGREDLL